MNLQEYIQRIKLWIGKQYFIIRHYKIIISVFLIILIGVLMVGIFYPREEETIHIYPDTRQKHDNNNDIGTKKDGELRTIETGRLLYDVSTVERAHPWREVFKELPDRDLLRGNEDTKVVDEELDGNDDVDVLGDVNYSGSNKYKRGHRTDKHKNRRVQSKSKQISSNTISVRNDDFADNQTSPNSHRILNSSSIEESVELVGIIEGNQTIAILRKGTDEQVVTVGSIWHGVSVSNINKNGVEIIEGGSSRWLRIE